MKYLALIIITASSLASCVPGIEIITHTPYGSGQTNPDGSFTYTPPAKPITFPIYNGK